MIFLYNKERVVLEGLELVKYKISQRIGFKENIVEGGFIITEGKLTPDFQIDVNKVPEEYHENLQEIVTSEWQKGLVVINERLSNLGK